MMKLLAGVFVGVASIFGGLFGHGHTASTTPPFAHATSTAPWAQHMGSSTPNRMGMMPGAIGKVTVVSGTTITITPIMGMHASSTEPTSLTIDASNAKIYSNASTTISVGDIKVGDTVMAMGTRSGTTITATIVRDGIPPRPQGMGSTTPGMGHMQGMQHGSMQGMGQNGSQQGAQ